MMKNQKKVNKLLVQRKKSPDVVANLINDNPKIKRFCLILEISFN